MKSQEKPKKQPQPVRATHKTKEDFLRWLRKQEGLKKQASEGKSK